MRFSIFLAVFLLVKPLAADEPPAFSSAEQFFDYASVIHSSGDWSAAAEQWEKFIEAHPADDHAPTARFRLSVAWTELGQHRKAATALRKAIDSRLVGADDLRARFALAAALARLGDPGKAAAEKDALSSALEADFALPPDVMFKVGSCRYAAKDFAAAARAFQLAWRADPWAPLAAHAARFEGECRLRLDEPFAAEVLFRCVLVGEALRPEPDAALIATVRGLLAHALLHNAHGRASRARAPAEFADVGRFAESIVGRGPAEVSDLARLLAAECYLRAGRTADADRALSRGTGNPGSEERSLAHRIAYARLGDKYGYTVPTDIKQLQAAAGEYARFADTPGLPDDLKVLALATAGKCREKAGEWAEAVTLFDRQLAVSRRGPLAADSLARKSLCHLALGQLPLAREAVAVAVKEESAARAAALLVRVARRCEATGHLVDATAYYRQVGTLVGAPRTTVADGHVGLARVAVRQKGYAAAAGHLIDSLPYRPGAAPEIQLRAAHCYEAAGEFSKALAQYRHAAAGPDEVKALAGVARCLEALGRREDALDVLYDLATRFPSDRPEVADAESRLKAARRK